MNNTPTPRTDELYRDHMSDPYQDTGDLAAIMHIQCERFERELAAVTKQLKETQEALAAEIKHHTETTAKWNGHHMDLTITQCDLNTAHRTLKEVTEQRDKYRDIANELIAMIRINVMRDTFKTATTEQVNEYLKQWIERIATVKGGSDE